MSLVPLLRRASRRSTLAVPLTGFLAFGAVAFAQDPDVRLRLTPSDTVGTEDLLRLEIAVESGSSRQPPMPQASFGELVNLRLEAGPAQSTRLQIVNGAATASLSLTWHLRPTAPGPAAIRDIDVRVGDRTFRLDDAEIEVVEGSLAPRRRRSPFDVLDADPRDPFARDPLDDFFGRRRRNRRPPPAPEIHLEAEVTPPDPVVGEQALYTLYLYTDVTVRSVDPTELPDFEGFWVTVLPQKDRPDVEQVVRDGRRTNRVVLLQRALFPRRAGDVVIPPLEARLLADVPDPSPFGSLLPRTVEMERSSGPVTVRVRELPEPLPAGFQGAVGRLEAEASLEPGVVKMGEAATLTLRLSGDGHLQGLPAPELQDVAGLRFFPPQQQSKEELRGTRVRGERIWSWVVVPERPGTFEVPTIELPFWHPSRGDWATATADVGPLHVEGATRLTSPEGETLELRSIRTAAIPPPLDTGTIRRWAVPLYATPWFLAVGLLLWRRRASPGSRTARRHLLEHLREAETEDRPRLVAAKVEDAWRDFLTERHGIPPGTPSTQWAQTLEEHGVPRADADELVRLADDLHYLRYAPKLSSVEDVQRELLERSRRLARRLA